MSNSCFCILYLFSYSVLIRPVRRKYSKDVLCFKFRNKCWQRNQWSCFFVQIFLVKYYSCVKLYAFCMSALGKENFRYDQSSSSISVWYVTCIICPSFRMMTMDCFVDSNNICHLLFIAGEGFRFSRALIPLGSLPQGYLYYKI